MSADLRAAAGPAGRRRLRRGLSSAIALLVIAFVVVAVAIGRGESAPSVRLRSGAAWFASVHQGSVALLDGATGTRVARVDRVAPPDADVAVALSGAAALVVNRDAGTVTKVDGATWRAGAPVPVASGRDGGLDVYAGGDRAWVVSQGGTIAQQLDPPTMTLLGSPLGLPDRTSAVVAASDGRLWAAAATGELRSYHDGQQTSAEQVIDPGPSALGLVGDRPVAVNLQTGHAVLVDRDRGRADRPLCLDVATSPPPNIAGAADAPWLLAVAPSKGTLVVSDIDTNVCHTIALGPTAPEPRYGSPVGNKGFVFVPDASAGQVIVVDPSAPPERQVRARVDLGFQSNDLVLSVHDQHVWFNEVRGDRAGVITDDLKARVVSKSDAATDAKEGRPLPGARTSGDAPASGATGDAGVAASASSGTPTAGANPAGPASPGAGPADLPAPATDGDPAGPGGGSDGGSDAGGGASAPDLPPPASTPPTSSAPPSSPLTVDFTASPTSPVVGDLVTFTDTTTGSHTVARWSAPGGSPPSTSSPAKAFSTTFSAPGTVDVTLTVDTTAGARSVTHQVTVGAQPTVPNLKGLTPAQAQQALAQAGLQLGSQTSTIDSPLATGLIVDSQPAAGSSAARGTSVSYRASQTLPFAQAQFSFFEPQHHGLVSGPDGNLWMTETTRNKILRITPDFVFTEFDVPTPNSAPFAITVGKDGNLWFTEHQADKIGRIDPRGSITELSIPAGAGPAGIVAASDGQLWFAETFRSAVGHIAMDGSRFGEIRLPRPNGAPFPITQTPDGNIWVSETATNFIDRVTANGTVTSVPLLPGLGGATHLLPTPNGTVAYLRSGADTGAIGLIATDLSFHSEHPTRFRPSGLTVGADGFVWFTEEHYNINGPGDLVSIDAAGNERRVYNVDLFDAKPVLVVSGPGNMLWFIKEAGSRIARVTLP